MPETVKYTALFVCVFIALIVWRVSPRKRDARLQVITFCFTVVADYFLLFTDLFTVGVIIFWGAHLTALSRYRKRWLPAGLVLAGAGAICGIVLSITGKNTVILFVACIVYAALILAVTIATFFYKQGCFGDLCSRLGMIAFLCCDVNVAIFNTAEAGSSLYNISAPLMWAFYLPAQILLALSAAGAGARGNSGNRANSSAG